MYDFTLERFLWTSFYRNSFLFLPPGPFSSQSVSDLERILVQAQKVDKNWNQTKPDVPKFKTIRQLSIESVAPAIQLLRGRYLLVGLAKSLSLYDLERSDASWDEPICIVDTVNDTEFDSKLGLSNSVEWYLNEEAGSVMYAATLATKISPTEHEIEPQKILVWKIEPTAPTVISQVASIPLKLPIMYNIYVSGTFVVCHSVAYPRCRLQDSLVYHIPTGKVYHFAELTVEMASLSILFDRLLLTSGSGQTET
ncbi:hypothetical protein K435DRAFT_834135 [Dendrothele bispora CBS 962.96]|uniref:Uncharacterized protein n=1 Tax=Dendrothele bispora (strain CBS 962.96) TaxID=1314807 RepID=A0A4S8MTV0_DENBC|nr:hypothetical protein K435DRAFT_834135 [Dendrothele bispora CBS 962.96]